MNRAPERILVFLPANGSWVSAFPAATKTATSPLFLFAITGQDDLASLAVDISAAGIIVCADALGNYGRFPATDLPTVFVGGRGGQAAGPEVRPDDGAVGELVATAFANAGRIRVALVGPRTDSKPYGMEVASFFKSAAVHDLQLPRSLIVEVDADRVMAAEAVRMRLKHAERLPQAVFCTAPVCALGVHDAVTALGLGVPHDVAIVAVGSENLPMLTDRDIVVFAPAATTMVERALEMLDGPSAGPPVPVVATVPYQLVASDRDSQVMRAMNSLRGKTGG